ncbi:hypothetical protein Clacol_001027 [Clathrus columnatus]|uniref:Uncharacterized protein n=1 Tax=Clathrus columnatus TaxID=1419009 RepID=A0AAV5A2P6_9AGAM|nr:hypothetical protein Clacol_001027 [Clathrus columnatus]
MRCAHIQWASATIRHCLELVSSPSLQIDIFVTNTTPDLKTTTHLSTEVSDFLPRQPYMSVTTDNETNHSRETSFDVSTDSSHVEDSEVLNILDTDPEQ